MPVPTLNPVMGVHTYVSASLAVNVVKVFSQMVAEGTDTKGIGFTVTTTVVLAVQLAADEPTTV
jgi:hypothetical protein